MDCSNMADHVHVKAQTIPAPSFVSSISPLPTTSTPPPPLSAVAPNAVVSPCAACKILRRRCDEKCILAPYFPPTEPHKFTISHRVFGASNIVKFLQELPEGQRADAVSSMVYEASARIRDPVYGCAGAISQLQKQLSQLQAELAKAQAEIVTMQCQQAHLVALLCMEVTHSPLLPTTPFREQSPGSPYTLLANNGSSFFDENNSGSLWEPLWI